MKRTTITLDDDQLRALEQLAATRRQTVDTLVHDAIDAYLQERVEDHAGWRDEFGRLLADVASRIPPSITPEEIEADITAAREEVRQARRAARGR
jgi:predicted transcriptional regulator